MTLKLLRTAAVLAAVSMAGTAFSAVPVYLDDNAPLEARVDDALSRMTTAEKIAIIHAQSKFCSAGVPRLGIAELWTSDGPHGVRPEVMWDQWEQAGWTNDSCVAFPALTALAATWDPAMSRLYGESIGQEAAYRGKDVLLGPGVNIYRTPLNGRNFEYMGEDPYLSSMMVAPYIKGLQEQGVAACVKHYALNNNEVNRHTTNVVIDDRTLYEIYLPAFKAAADAGAWSFMAAYNLNGDQHMCHNARFLNDILKGEWGFDGAVLSDWGGCHDTRQAISNGLDLEFGSWTNGLSDGSSNAYDNYFLAMPYLRLIADGEAGTAELDDKARRVLRLMFRTSMKHRPPGSMCSPEHYAAARSIGNAGIVLLKNEGKVLPMRTDNHPRVLVVGENAVKMMTVGGGSSSLKAQHEVLPLEGLRAALDGKADVEWVRGYVGDVTGEYNGVVSGQNLADSRSAGELIAEAVAKARDADYVIFVGGLNKAEHQDCEDTDRESLALPYAQDAVIEAIAAVNPNLVMVNVSGNAVAMPWADKVPAIVQAWYLGSEAGNSLADVLTGAVNPSGKLPFTFPRRLEDVGAHALDTYPGISRADSYITDMEYKEGVLVGYRWADAKGTDPLFPFGHGLSYTTFAYGPASLDKTSVALGDSVMVSVDVTNTGAVPGAEVVQLYVGDRKASVVRPPKELKAFQKVYLQPGESRTVTFTLGEDALSFFDADNHRWVAEPGDFTVNIGSSSRDIRSTAKFKLTK